MRSVKRSTDQVHLQEVLEMLQEVVLWIMHQEADTFHHRQEEAQVVEGPGET
jgi:hypothetical protein